MESPAPPPPRAEVVSRACFQAERSESWVAGRSSTARAVSDG